MFKNRLQIAAALSVFAVSACAQIGTTHAPIVPSTPAQVAAAAEAPAGWRPFSADSPWNTKIAADAMFDPGSPELIAAATASNALYINIPEWTVATYYIDSATTPKRPFFPYFYGVYGRGFAPGSAIPAPDFAKPSGPDGGTEFLSMIDPKAGKAWEMRQPSFNAEDENWRASFGAEVDLTGTGVPTPWMQAAQSDAHTVRPSGIPLTAGLIRLDEIKAGRIDHALAFAYPAPRTGQFVSPAADALPASDTRPANHFGLPLGARIQLDPNYDIENTRLSPTGKVIARALQEYGAILVDDAGAITLFAEGSPTQVDAWRGVLSPTELQLLFTPDMMATNFRVIDTGEPMAGRPRPLR
ncbi:hypothetical protein K1X12_16550 [Hyphomonas sp. WL0036]|uniref:hypothetical protein n=1 Tax=Hyphomonas sediminis TaxID=2866160 RepID=UPI001C7E25C1|nr:hypothetical protein [Hyphomonas sediminis]MBY9068508.1 hypothetical protein [Hyphomonas sediminis]